MVFIFILLKINRADEFKSLSFLQRLAKLDLLGASILVPALICLLLALQWGGTQFPWNGSQIIGLFVGSVLMIILFAGSQIWKGDAGILPPRFFRYKDIVCAMFFSTFLGASMVPLIYYLCKSMDSTRSIPLTIPWHYITRIRRLTSHLQLYFSRPFKAIQPFKLGLNYCHCCFPV